MDRKTRPSGITFDKKIILVLDQKITPDVALNVASHISLSLGAHSENILGDSLMDISRHFHFPLCKYPVVILQEVPKELNSL